MYAVETPRSSRKPAPYPGFDLDPTDEIPDDVIFRVKPEGEEFYLRNRGSIQNWAFHGEDDGFVSHIQNSRCPTRESLQNILRDKRGTIKLVLEGRGSPPPEAEYARIRPEAEVIADVSRGGRMCRLLANYGETEATPRVARVKSEAMDTATVSQGGRMNKLIHSYGKMPISHRSIPRVKPEAADIAEVSKGKRMNNIVHLYGKCPLSDRQVPRVKTEAEDNAELDKGKRMNRLVHKYGKIPRSPKAVPRVKTAASENADLDKGKRMDRLMHSGHTLPKSPRGPPRVKNLEGNNNLYRGRGSMGKMLREMGQRTCIFVPGVSRSCYLKEPMV